MRNERTPLIDLIGQPWAMREIEFARFMGRAMAVASDPSTYLAIGNDPKAYGFLLREEDEEELPYEQRGDVAIVRVRGALFRQATYFSQFFGDRTYSGIADCFKQAMHDDSVRSIVFDIDSPGGDALGLSELSDLIFAAREKKPSTAVIRGLGASAAYFIASSAARVVCAKEAMVGSIGTVATYLDWKQFDAKIGIKEIEIVSSQSPKKRPDPSTDEGRSQIQRQVDDIAENFVQSVARNRGVSREIVLRDYGQGDVFVGQRAVDAGLADEISTLDEVIERAAEEGRRHSRAALVRSMNQNQEDRMKTIEVDKITAEWLAQNCPEVAAKLRSEGVAAAAEAHTKALNAAVEAHGKALDTARTEAKSQGVLEGADSERKRILGIEEMAVVGHEELVAAAKKDPKATRESVAVAIVDAQRKARGSKLQLLRDDEKQVEKVAEKGPEGEEPKGKALGKKIAEMA